MKRNRRKRVAARGMTLTEIMVVVAIIGMVMGSVAIYAVKQLDKASITNTKNIIKTIEQALVLYQTDKNEQCPKTLNDLKAEKFLNKDPVDAWNEPLIFRCPGQHNTDGADIVSKGKDKQEGTGDDIKSWEQ